MLKRGADYIEGLRDGRVIYVGGERVDDVTTHPGFHNAVRSYARIYDARFEDQYRDVLSYEENGERFATYFLQPRSREDLEKRTKSCEAIAELTYGMMGRSPDFVGGYIAGAAMQPEVFDSGAGKFSSHVTSFYDYCRRNDVFLSHAVTPPQGTRDKKMYQREAARVPALGVVSEDDTGVTITGTKMLATSAAFSDEIWIGNLLPLAEDHESESITCIVPPNAPGLSLWSRKTYERYAVSEFDNYLSYHFDEGDCIVVCESVKVPWERVLTHNDIGLSRQIYFRTPAHTLSNHQAGVRYAVKLKLLLGLARLITKSSGIDTVPAVADDLGHLAALYGMMKGMIYGQIQDHEKLGNGYVNYNRHYMYAAIYFATQHYDQICAKVRELSGGSVLQMPADVSVLHNPETRKLFEEFWQTPNSSAVERFKLYKLAWDLLGTDFAGRHLQYERFYMGPAFVVRAHNSRECPWPQIESYVTELLHSYGPGELLTRGFDGEHRHPAGSQR
jgi:4-hydroxyphenylacetate 3-monooxygenase